MSLKSCDTRTRFAINPWCWCFGIDGLLTQSTRTFGTQSGLTAPPPPPPPASGARSNRQRGRGNRDPAGFPKLGVASGRSRGCLIDTEDPATWRPALPGSCGRGVTHRRPVGGGEAPGGRDPPGGRAPPLAKRRSGAGGRSAGAILGRPVLALSDKFRPSGALPDWPDPGGFQALLGQS